MTEVLPATLWVPHVLPEGLLGLLGPRMLDAAIASKLRYASPPSVVDHAVRAAFSGAGSRDIAVVVRVADRASVVGTCARCVQSFGPCVHVATLIVDLAHCRALRDALIDGGEPGGGADEAYALREKLLLERNFERTLDDWLLPTQRGTAVDIAATVEPIDGHARYALGVRSTESGHLLSVMVRRRGSRKLLSSRELGDRLGVDVHERRVLKHTKDGGSGRKSLVAAGVDASMTLEAMRAHGGIFAVGWKKQLEFRSDRVRPTLDLRPGGDESAELVVTWTSEDGVTLSAEEGVFFPGPFPYLWSSSGVVFPVARDVDVEVAGQLATRARLRIPAGRLLSVGTRLYRATHRLGVVMPPREAFGLPALDAARFILRLVGDPLDLRGELLAVYRSREVVLRGGRRDEAPEGDTRDREAEARAVQALFRAGLVASEDHGELTLTDEAAVEFWQKGLASLRAEEDPPIEVVLTESLARVRVGAPLVSRLRVALAGNWLDTELEFRSEDLRAELGQVKEALARKRRWVRLSDGTLARISQSVAELTEEATLVLEDDGHGLLPAHQLGRLDRWLEDNDGRVDAHVDALRARLRALAVATEPTMPEKLDGTLRPYQRRGLAWLQFLWELGAGGVLADDMGLGKTITTLAFLAQRKEAEGRMPSLVVCPTSVVGNWARESARFTPDLAVVLLGGVSRASRIRDQERIAKADLVVTTYGLLRRDAESLASHTFRVVVLDEAQNIKNADARTTRAAGRLTATMRLALSGTPMENRLAELWSLASFANPGMLGSLRAFETRFERPIARDPKSPIGAELRALVRPFLLRRTKGEVLAELPAKTEIDRFVTLRASDKRMYDALAHTLRASVAKDIERRDDPVSLSVLTALTRLRQMACDPRLVDPKAAASESRKREAFLELVRELVAEGRRALVFSQFVQLLSLWRTDLDAEKIPYEYLDGSTVQRDAVVQRFQEGSAPLFLLSLKAGGAGLNLTAADTVIHCDPWWNPAVEDQATDRAHRIGQDKPVTVVRLVARGTIEEKILSLKERKRDLARAVIGGEAGALAGLTAEDVRRLLGDADLEAVESASASPTDRIATDKAIVSPEYEEIARRAQRWIRTTGRKESDLARLTDLPPEYAFRLLRGEPFPCSRAVAARIRERLESG